MESRWRKNVGLVSDYEFENFIKAKCQDLALQSWQIMLQSNSLCYNYRLYEHRFVFESYLETLLRSDRVKLTNFRCAATALPTVKSKFLNCPVESCPFCETRCKRDEYHLVLKCESFDDKRKELLPEYYYDYPSDIKYDRLMNVTDKNLTKNFAKFLHSILTRCSRTDINL